MMVVICSNNQNLLPRAVIPWVLVACECHDFMTAVIDSHIGYLIRVKAVKGIPGDVKIHMKVGKGGE